MYFLVLVVATFGYVTSDNHFVPPASMVADLNNKLLKALNVVNDHLAITLEDNGDAEKVQFSLFATALLFYVNMGNSMVKYTDDTRYVAIRQVSDLAETQTADVFASPVRKNLDYFKSFVTLPITDVKTACPYNVTENECLKNLQPLINFRKTTCSQYQDHIDLYQLAIKLATEVEQAKDDSIQHLLAELLDIIKLNNNFKIFEFFASSVLKYPKVYETFKKLHGLMLTHDLPCQYIFDILK